MIGSTLGSRYEIEEIVGEGGMAITYRARDRLLNRDVAVKVLRDQFLMSDEFVERFNREAQSAASLSHPNISTVYDIGRQDSMRFIVMEYVNGPNLEQFVREKGALPIDVVVAIARQVCSALSHAHEKGIVHRDIKPSNILLSDGWRLATGGQSPGSIDGRHFIKVTDFGIARALAADSITVDQSILGTANYLSPEQAKGETAGPASDLYSLGAVLYYMITGKVPFSGESPVAIAMKHVSERPVPPSQLRPEIPWELSSIIMRALEKDLGRRYASAAEILNDLNGLDVRKTRSFPEVQREATVDDVDRTQILPGAAIAAATAPSNDRWQDHTSVIPPASGGGHARSIPQRVERNWLPAILTVCVLLAILSAAIGIYVGAPGLISSDAAIAPDVVRMQLNEARRVIQEADLRTGSVEFRADSEIPANYVIRQMPPAGERVKHDATIDLVVSKGDEIELTEVPDLIDMTQKRAAQELQRYGLTLGKASTETNDQIANGLVIRQSLEPDTRVQRGATVDVVVSSGPPPPPPEEKPEKLTKGTVEYEVPDSPEEQLIKIVLHDDDGEHQVYEKTHAPGDKITVQITGKGRCQARVFNGNTLEETRYFEPEGEE